MNFKNIYQRFTGALSFMLLLALFLQIFPAGFVMAQGSGGIPFTVDQMSPAQVVRLAMNAGKIVATAQATSNTAGTANSVFDFATGQKPPHVEADVYTFQCDPQPPDPNPGSVVVKVVEQEPGALGLAQVRLVSEHKLAEIATEATELEPA